jgi:hypothetical protein
MDVDLLSGFLSAIQMFSTQLTEDPKAGIKEMTLQNIKLLYKRIQNYIFVGLVDTNESSENVDTVMEYLICSFIASFYKELTDGCILETSQFTSFDAFFDKWRSAKEKDLEKWVQSLSPTLLQGVLNRILNYIPAVEIVAIDPDLLYVVGKKLVWVARDIPPEKEQDILGIIQNKFDVLYGPGLFATIEKDAKAHISL